MRERPIGKDYPCRNPVQVALRDCLSSAQLGQSTNSCRKLRQWSPSEPDEAPLSPSAHQAICLNESTAMHLAKQWTSKKRNTSLSVARALYFSRALVFAATLSWLHFRYWSFHERNRCQFARPCRHMRSSYPKRPRKEPNEFTGVAELEVLKYKIVYAGALINYRHSESSCWFLLFFICKALF